MFLTCARIENNVFGCHWCVNRVQVTSHDAAADNIDEKSEYKHNLFSTCCLPIASCLFYHRQ